jgi:hypothetical protein
VVVVVVLSSSLPSLCSGSSISATAGNTTGTGFLEVYGGRSAVLEFQVHFRNNTHLPAISVSETRRNDRNEIGRLKSGGSGEEGEGGPQECYNVQ